MRVRKLRARPHLFRSSFFESLCITMPRLGYAALVAVKQRQWNRDADHEGVVATLLVASDTGANPQVGQPLRPLKID